MFCSRATNKIALWVVSLQLCEPAQRPNFKMYNSRHFYEAKALACVVS